MKTEHLHGLGHQFDQDLRRLTACKSALEQSRFNLGLITDHVAIAKMIDDSIAEVSRQIIAAVGADPSTAARLVVTEDGITVWRHKYMGK